MARSPGRGGGGGGGGGGLPSASCCWFQSWCRRQHLNLSWIFCLPLALAAAFVLYVVAGVGLTTLNLDHPLSGYTGNLSWSYDERWNDPGTGSTGSGRSTGTDHHLSMLSDPSTRSAEKNRSIQDYKYTQHVKESGSGTSHRHQDALGGSVQDYTYTQHVKESGSGTSHRHQDALGGTQSPSGSAETYIDNVVIPDLIANNVTLPILTRDHILRVTKATHPEIWRSLFYRVDLDQEIKHSIKGAPMNYLPEYTNPCWVEALDSVYPYDGDTLNRQQHYPKMLSERLLDSDRHLTPRQAFLKLSAIFKQRASDGEPWRLRCLPGVFIVGVTKSGTTDLFDKMLLHPHIIPPSVKEPMWWNRQTIRRGSRRAVPFKEYLDLFDYAAELIRTAEPDKGQDNHDFYSHITVDGSPANLWDYDGWSKIPGNAGLQEPRYILAHSLRRLIPDARIVAILRNPVDRLHSQFLMKSASNRSSYVFHQLVVNNLATMTRCLAIRTNRSCAYDARVSKNEFTDPGGIFLRASMYSVFIKDWLAVFPRNQLKVVLGEDYYRDRGSILNDIFNFLGLEPLSDALVWRLQTSVASNSREQKEPMQPDTRRILNEFYAPFNEELARVLGDDKFLWKT